MKQTITRRVKNEDDEAWHIPGEHNSQITLCGFVDVPYEESNYAENPCSCRHCIEALHKIQALKFPKGYFKP